MAGLGYEVLLVDLDGTLIDYGRTEQAALRDVHRQCYPGVTFTEFHDSFAACNDVLWDAYRKGEIDLDTLRVERFSWLSALTGAPVAPDAAAARFEASLSRHAVLYEEARSALWALSRTYRMVLVTDGIAKVQHAKLRKTGLRRFFDKLVISTEVGCRKPQPTLLYWALAQVGVVSERALMVGDSQVSDGATALAAGVDFCWVDRKGVELVMPARYLVHNLTGLVRILTAEPVPIP